MDVSSPFLISEESGTLRIAWDNRRVHKANLVLGVIILSWIVFTPITLLATCGMFLPSIDVLPRIFCVFWSAIGWVFVVAVPYGIIARTWSEWIEISQESISYGCIGFLARRSKTFPLNTVIELGCGLRGNEWERESMITLNIMRSGGFLGNPRRQMFGYWLAANLKVQVFETIEEFVTKNQIPLKMTRYGPWFGKASPKAGMTEPPKPSPID